MAGLRDLYTDEAGRTSGTKLRLWGMFFLGSLAVLMDMFTEHEANVPLLTLLLGTFVIDRGVSKIANMKYGNGSS